MIEFKYPEQRTELEDYVSENSIPESRLWFDGERVVIKDIDTALVPDSVSPRQIRQALNHSGLRSAVEDAVSAGDQDLKDWWEFATAFERSHPLVIGMAQDVGVSEAQLDDLFRLAASL